MTRLAFVVAVAALACKPHPEGAAPEQLEAFKAGAPDVVEDAVTYAGTLTVTGADRDFTFTVSPAEGEPVSFDVHSPTAADLTVLHGLDVTAVLDSTDLHGQRSLYVSGAEGLLYAADAGWSAAQVAEKLGADAVAYGSEVGTDRDDLYDWTFRSVAFPSDDGTVELVPGETDSIVLGGANFRVGAVAAYEVEPRPNAALPCGGIGDLLSYEILRVPEIAEPIVIERASGHDLAHSGCM